MLRIYPQPTHAEAEQFVQEIIKRQQVLEQLTPEERERYEIEETIGKLKMRRTMRRRTDYAQFLDPKYLDKLQRHDPEFMTPIITGVQNRPARKEKAENAIRRINQRTGANYRLWQR